MCIGYAEIMQPFLYGVDFSFYRNGPGTNFPRGNCVTMTHHVCYQSYYSVSTLPQGEGKVGTSYKNKHIDTSQKVLHHTHL